MARADLWLVCAAEGDEGAAGHAAGQRAGTHRSPEASAETAH